MQRLMLRVKARLQRHRKLVIGCWAVALLVAIPFAARENSGLTGGGFEAPNSQSTTVAQAVAHSFPGIGSSTNLGMVLVPQRNAGPRDLRDAILAVNSQVSRVKGVRLDPEGLKGALIGAQMSPRQSVVMLLGFMGSERRAVDIAAELRAELGIVGSQAGHMTEGRVEVHVVGQGAIWATFQQQAKSDSIAAEARAFPVIAIVLLLTFGSLAAMALPLSLGVASVILTGAVIYALSQVTLMSLYVTSMASLIGIGVAVDYSLFVLARYREEVRAGRSPEQARIAAMATSGVAVIFSSITVIVSLCGIFLINSTAMRSIAAGAMIVVATSALAASTLLPVLISLLGHRTYEPGLLAKALQRRRRYRRTAVGRSFWERWANLVMRHPALSAVAGVAVLLVIAAPAVKLRLANFALDQLPPQNEIRQGTLAAAQILGQGALGPALVLVSFTHGDAGDRANQLILSRLTAAIESDRTVSYVLPPLVSSGAHSAELTTVLKVDPESSAAHKAIERLRTTLPRVARNAEVDVGGTAADLLDFDHLVVDSLWKILVFVLALSFVVLVLLLRSIVLPIKAVIMNMLAVAASYGALVAVFQWGWLEVLGLRKVPSIESILLPLILVVTFGLSMDYEIFLLTRIRERYIQTGDNRRAVAEGLASSAPTITSAALIMITVCIAFLGSGLGALQRLGLAIAVALAVDATVVRLVIVPAAMTLLGKWNWWMPAGLARLLPIAHVETLDIELEPADSPPSAERSVIH